MERAYRVQWWYHTLFWWACAAAVVTAVVVMVGCTLLSDRAKSPGAPIRQMTEFDLLQLKIMERMAQ